jgi:hypothetical protein
MPPSIISNFYFDILSAGAGKILPSEAAMLVGAVLGMSANDVISIITTGMLNKNSTE